MLSESFLTTRLVTNKLTKKVARTSSSQASWSCAEVITHWSSRAIDRSVKDFGQVFTRCFEIIVKCLWILLFLLNQGTLAIIILSVLFRSACNWIISIWFRLFFSYEKHILTTNRFLKTQMTVKILHNIIIIIVTEHGVRTSYQKRNTCTRTLYHHAIVRTK